MLKFLPSVFTLFIVIVKAEVCDSRDESLRHRSSSPLGWQPNVRPRPIYGDEVEERAFSAFWNLPTYECLNKFGIELHLEKFGIIANEDGNVTGDALVLFPQLNFGRYPHFDKVTQEPVNGGLPQLANLTLHLEKAAQDIIVKIPNANFSGLAVIDWELWHPIWAQNIFGGEIYCQKSLDFVKTRHPKWDSDLIEMVAKVEFEEAARSFMESTISLVKQMRPKARLGFYHYPNCMNRFTASNDCNPKAIATNDELTWLFAESTTLYPSIYLYGSKSNYRSYVESNIQEALRVRKMTNLPQLPIIAYTRFNYSHSGLYYTKADLNNTILHTAELGANGVVFWGDHNDTSSLQSCMQLQSYLDTFLGPFVKEVISAASRCSEEMCSGHGRCVGDIFQGSTSRVLEVLTRRKDKNMNGAIQCTSCSCYEGWQGGACEEHSIEVSLSAPLV